MRDHTVLWYGSRPRPRPHCVRRRLSPCKRDTAAPLFLARVCCGHGCPSQLLLSSCFPFYDLSFCWHLETKPHNQNAWCWSVLFDWFPHNQQPVIITACMVLQAVVKANSQSNGNGLIWTPWAQKLLNGFRWNLEYITVGGCDHTQIHMSLQLRGWSRRTRDLSRVAVSWYTFLVLYSSPSDQHRLTIYTSYDMFPHKEMPFGGRDETVVHLGSKSPNNPNFRGVNMHFQAKLASSKNVYIIETTASIPAKFCRVIKTSKCLSWMVQTRPTNPRWWTASIFEK